MWILKWNWPSNRNQEQLDTISTNWFTNWIPRCCLQSRCRRRCYPPQRLPWWSCNTTSLLTVWASGRLWAVCCMFVCRPPYHSGWWGGWSRCNWFQIGLAFVSSFSLYPYITFCAYIRTYIHTYVCILLCVHTYVCVYYDRVLCTYVYMYVCTMIGYCVRTYICMYVYVCTYVHTYVYSGVYCILYIRMCVCTYVCMYVHSYSMTHGI